MDRRKLPIGIQTFREVREDGCYYVDKTAYIRRLLGDGKHYFLSRPRRFGKSLFLDTLKELFEGNEALFEGLHIHRHWDWSVRHPVVRLDFGAGHFKDPGHLEANVMEQLDAAERRASLGSDYRTVPGRLASLLERAARAHRAAGGGADRRVRQTDSGRPGNPGGGPAPTGTICGGCTRSSSRATPTSASPSSPG